MLALCLALLLSAPLADDHDTLLLRQPAVGDGVVVFAYANDLWVVSDEGGEARRLTSFPGTESSPHVSPDGQMVAFSAQYDGNTDVYVVPMAGGEPQRLTYHPSGDVVQGWMPNGDVLFESNRRGGPRLLPRLYSIGLDGGMPAELIIPRAERGQVSPDGRFAAYQLVSSFDPEWRNYKGGQVQPIRILDLETYDLEKIPHTGARDLDPSWAGSAVVFLSERDLAMNLYWFDTATDELTQLTTHADYDVKSYDVSADGSLVVYEQGGRLHRLDPATRVSTPLSITVRGDLPWSRPQWEDVDRSIVHAGLSPTGKRVAFEARGEVFTVPVEDGTWRNLTASSGAADRDPAWSPDGQHVAYFSDASGEYQLIVEDQSGLEPARAIDLPGPTFYYTPRWSPDGTTLALTDTDLNMWVVDIESGETTLVDTDNYAHPQRTFVPNWSPDSRWITYAKRLDSQLHVVMVYDTESGETTQITDGLADALSPVFDRGGRHLFFFASTNLALNTGWLDMSSYERPVRRGLYAAVLRADDPSPLKPKSDEEPSDDAEEESGDEEAGDDESDKGEEDDDAVRIDFEGLAERIVAFDVPERAYANLVAGPAGTVLYNEFVPNADGVRLMKYSVADREAKEVLPNARSIEVSANGEKLLYRAGSSWFVTSAANPEAGKGRLSLGLRTKVDYAQEWRQLFREAWRYQRDYLYVENTHGADWDKVYTMYEPWLEHVRHRDDLNHVLDIMGGEVSVGHSYTFGGDFPDVDRVPVGLLGADYEMVDGRPRITRIFTAEAWNPNLSAPLSGPGMDVKEGEFLVGVNGVEITPGSNVYSYFEQTAGRLTTIHVNDQPSMDGARTVDVVPVSNEGALRMRAWVEDSRRRVDELSDGKLAYVYVPNTAGAGYTYFNRYYFAQQDRQGVVIDERYNGGGSAADYMVDIMAREPHGYFNNPVGERRPWTSPGAGIWGPKVMIINEMAGSGGDLLPYMFRRMELGTLVGTRTWGGLVGIWDVPPLIDGGGVTAPRGGFIDLDGNWAVENEGVAPDVEVEMTPKDVIAGRDPQLERAVEIALEQLNEQGYDIMTQEPAPPVRAMRPAGGGE
ncbi:MAG: PDZ domain-containing protein [Bacteroidota bacterium]